MPETPRRLRCAIYTRVSTDAGLDQEFNSLDAQREAAEAFIKSQAHEGWTLAPDAYDDGGYSGGSLDRPALQKLLDNIRIRAIDTVLVYKVDRLTRSLADFAKLVELFDAHGVSFVSVTQAFNTTNSMGRLTLNVLLSFAQFEREVTAERIRDKVAASKKKGVWMGGSVPLGYQVENRKLLVDAEEVATIKMIFARYLELGSVIALVEELRWKGVRTRVRQAAGRNVGGVPFTAGPLAYLLKNRIYIGDTVHKGRAYAGEHEPILEKDVFEAVQARLATNRTGTDRKGGRSNAALLGKIFDDCGNIMTPRHAQKGSRRYHYYTSRAFIEGRKDDLGSIPRVAANDIEPKIAAALVENLRIPTARGQTGATDHRVLLDRYVVKVVVAAKHLEVTLSDGPETLRQILVPWQRRSAKPRREVLTVQADAATPNPMKAQTRKLLVRSIARSRQWLNELSSGKADSIETIAKREKCSTRSIHMTLGLAFLAPDIVVEAVAGRLPKGMGLTGLHKFPTLWSNQHRVFSG